jgi:copper resistance protein D
VPDPTAVRTRPGTPALIGVVVGIAFAAVALATSLTDRLPVVVGIAGPDDGVRFGLPAARALMNVAGAITVGLCLVPVLLGEHRTPLLAERTRRAAVLSSATWLSATLVALWLYAIELNPARQVDLGVLADYVANVAGVQGLVATAVCTLGLLTMAVLNVRRPGVVAPELHGILALASLLPLPLTGHSQSTEYHDLVIPMTTAHVTAAATWLGGLLAIALFVLADRAALAVALPRFSKVATVALVVTGLSGLVSATLEILSAPGVGLGGLVTTWYGQLALVKLGCTAAVALLGAKIRFRFLPAVAARRPVAITGWVALEIAVMGIAFGLGTVLARTPVL